jgi:hypothetical protein
MYSKQVSLAYDYQLVMSIFMGSSYANLNLIAVVATAIQNRKSKLDALPACSSHILAITKHVHN